MTEKSSVKSYKKMSKKEQKAVNAKKRGSWYGLNPVTRVPPNPKAYSRAKQSAQTRRQMDY